MKKANIPRATLGRLPMYLTYVESHAHEDTVSAAEMARDLNLGEVMVRRDLSHVCSEGRPKVGYPTESLRANIEMVLGKHEPEAVVIVGIGGLGLALQRYKGFEQYGLKIVAGFDCDSNKVRSLEEDYPIYPMCRFEAYCHEHGIRIGIITVPAASAQTVCDMMVQSGIRAIWNFAPCTLKVPESVVIKNENLALSVAHLHLSVDRQDIHGELAGT